MMLPALPERDFTFREGVGFQIVAEGKRRGRRVRAVAAEPLAPAVAGEPQLVATSATAFAPATVANLGPGFDFLGCAVEGLGDHVTAEVCAALLCFLLSCAVQQCAGPHRNSLK